jgi:hypothetical protein
MQFVPLIRRTPLNDAAYFVYQSLYVLFGR